MNKVLNKKVLNKIILSHKDFISNNEIKWCTGCGDYSILKQMQYILPYIDINKENIVFVSGIGCSSRFPYYINTFGIHGIHGRAPSIATGIKLANPKLSVWIITGDGDALSIGANHLIHILRRNINVNILLFNNEIYGLTKGQFSPTSNFGKKNDLFKIKNIDESINPLLLALGSQATFIARSIDVNVKHLRKMLLECSKHIGTSFLEIYQNCNIFNDGAFEYLSKKNYKDENTIFIEHNQPMIYANNLKGIYLDGINPKIINLEKTHISINDLWIHDKYDRTKADILLRMYNKKNNFPCPFGIFFYQERQSYDQIFHEEIIKHKNVKQTLDDILN